MNTHYGDRTGSGPNESARYTLELMDSCVLRRDGVVVALKPREQRLVAVLALTAHRPCSRGVVSGLLWPEVTEARAAGSLRSAVFGLRRVAPRLLMQSGGQLSLSPEVMVDVRHLTVLAHRVIALAEQDSDNQVPEDGVLLLSTGELLPGWYEDWVLAERERLQQLRLAGLETLAELLLDTGSTANALAAALLVTELDPLRESAQRAVIRIHLANGNYHAAVQTYLQFRRTVLAELGIGPSMQMERLIRPLLDHSRRGRRAEDLVPHRAATSGS